MQSIEEAKQKAFAQWRKDGFSQDAELRNRVMPRTNQDAVLSSTRRVFLDWKPEETPAPLIAISGKMRSGKTTLANALSSATGSPVMSFADPLKEGCKALGIAVDEKNKDRVALQEIANFLVARDNAHFVKLFDARTASSRERFGAIIPDMRLPQEWAWAKASGFLLIRLEVSAETQIARGGQPTRLDHWTETSLDFLPRHAWDVYLEEGSGFEAVDVANRVDAVLAALKEQHGR